MLTDIQKTQEAPAEVGCVLAVGSGLQSRLRSRRCGGWRRAARRGAQARERTRFSPARSAQASECGGWTSSRYGLAPSDCLILNDRKEKQLKYGIVKKKGSRIERFGKFSTWSYCEKWEGVAQWLFDGEVNMDVNSGFSRLRKKLRFH